jgi:uncharacterized membrane protein YhaH (DUF805 family)
MIDNEALQSLEKLHQLKTDGVITAEDFEAAKERLLTAPATRAKASAPSGSEGGIERPADDDHFAWMLMPLKRYADFNGRSSRKEYWMFTLLIGLATLVMMLLITANTSPFGMGTVGTMAVAILIVGLCGILVPSIAVQVRRFHDQDKSGWFALLNLIPYAGSLIVLVFMLLPGTEGDNQYGPDPRI